MLWLIYLRNQVNILKVLYRLQIVVWYDPSLNSRFLRNMGGYTLQSDLILITKWKEKIYNYKVIFSYFFFACQNLQAKIIIETRKTWVIITYNITKLYITLPISRKKSIIADFRFSFFFISFNEICWISSIYKIF